MFFSDNIVSRIAELAAALTPVADIAALIDCDPDLLRLELAQKDSPVRRAYMTAKAATALEIRKRELELARAGSPLAVQLVHSYLSDMNAEGDL